VERGSTRLGSARILPRPRHGASCRLEGLRMGGHAGLRSVASLRRGQYLIPAWAGPAISWSSSWLTLWTGAMPSGHPRPQLPALCQHRLTGADAVGATVTILVPPRE
jgi:hypothetical protein